MPALRGETSQQLVLPGPLYVGHWADATELKGCEMFIWPEVLGRIPLGENDFEENFIPGSPWIWIRRLPDKRVIGFRLADILEVRWA